MIIDPIGSMANEIVADKNAKQVRDGAGTGFADRLGVHTTLSSDTVAVDSLVAQAMQTPKIRQDKVDALRASISSGSYTINPRETAAAVLQENAR